ncbi:NAD(P)H-binding protein [Actinoplanes sp. NPDC051411]|uniref:NAD(P)-dependent oxidoreductase n=1 Tax=Actinoplanes sp. NPDC051411 TaxID=3155522 RepID=UPI003434B0FB
MKVVVIGAAGRTGRLVVGRALADGHRVIAVVRHPETMPVEHPDCVVVRGDVLKPETLVDPLAAAEAVFYLAAEPGRATSVTRSFGMAHVVDLVRDSGGTARVFAVSPSAIDVSASASLWRRLSVRMVIDKVLRNRFLDHERTEDELRNGGVSWTVVRVRGLIDGPAGRYRTEVGNHIAGERPVSRGDLADFLVKALTDPDLRDRVVSLSGD